MAANNQKVLRIAGISILTALTIVLQIICTFIKFGPFSITLALTPIIVGGALYGKGCGAYLGGIFGAVVFLAGFFGAEPTTLFLIGENFFATLAICIIKGIAAGFFASVIYSLLAKKNTLSGVVGASIICPLVNTALFVAGMLLFFFDILSGWADGKNLIYYIIFGLAGLNFAVELAVNLILSSAVTRIIKTAKK